MPGFSVRSIDGTHVSVTVKGPRARVKWMFISFFRLLMEKEYFSAHELHDAITMASILPPSEMCDTYSVTVLDIQ